MANEAVDLKQAEGALNATLQNTRAVQTKLEGLLNVARLAREAQARRTAERQPAPLVRTVDR